MEKMTITINTGNASFEEPYKEQEIARILRELARKIENGSEPEKLMDINGSKVGTVVYE